MSQEKLEIITFATQQQALITGANNGIGKAIVLGFAKAGIDIALSKTPAAEERDRGIRVTAICPGAVNTEFWDTETVHLKFERSAMLTPEIVAQSILDTAFYHNKQSIEELTLMPSAGVL